MVEGATRKRPQEFGLTLREVVWESPDTATLCLEPSPEAPVYRAGQFLTIDPGQFPQLAALKGYLEHAKGHKELVRAYSVASAPHEPLLALTIQDEVFAPGHTQYPPLLSPLLVHGLRPGDRLRAKGYTGLYVLPDDIESKTEHVLHVVAGSGAVPSFSLIKDSLRRGLNLRHTYLASNKTLIDVLYRTELEALRKAHPERLRIVHTLTRETEETATAVGLRQGRVTQALLEELVPPAERETCWAYVCGPAITAWDRRKAIEARVPATPRFLETVIAGLKAMGIVDKRIRREAYG